MKIQFKKTKSNPIKKDNPLMIEYVTSTVYCFKVKSLFKDDFVKLSKTCFEEYGVNLTYDTRFNVITFHEIEYNMNQLTYNFETDGDINSKNFCKKLDRYDTENFPENVKQCYYYVKNILNIVEEGTYALNYICF